MSKRFVIVLSLALGVVIGVALAWGLRRATAQDVAGAPAGAAVPVAIAPGPGGMWIVYGNRLRVCGQGLAQAGVEPPVPECAEAINLY